jgi:hypothetical protein
MNGCEFVFCVVSSLHIAEEQETKLMAEMPDRIWALVHPNKKIESLFGTIQSIHPDLVPQSIVSVCGLESSIQKKEHSDFISRLNRTRDLFVLHIPCPIILWIHPFVFTAIIKDAPDFWSFKSGVFHFDETVN